MKLKVKAKALGTPNDQYAELISVMDESLIQVERGDGEHKYVCAADILGVQLVNHGPHTFSIMTKPNGYEATNWPPILGG